MLSDEHLALIGRLRRDGEFGDSELMDFVLFLACRPPKAEAKGDPTDTERLDFIESSSSGVELISGSWKFAFRSYGERYPTLREAIDVEMKARSG